MFTYIFIYICWFFRSPSVLSFVHSCSCVRSLSACVSTLMRFFGFLFARSCMRSFVLSFARSCVRLYCLSRVHLYNHTHTHTHSPSPSLSFSLPVSPPHPPLSCPLSFPHTHTLFVLHTPYGSTGGPGESLKGLLKLLFVCILQNTHKHNIMLLIWRKVCVDLSTHVYICIYVAYIYFPVHPPFLVESHFDKMFSYFAETSC